MKRKTKDSNVNIRQIVEYYEKAFVNSTFNDDYTLISGGGVIYYRKQFFYPKVMSTSVYEEWMVIE